MAKHEDLTGKIFGKLTVIKEVGHPKAGIYLWECECNCSNHTHIIVNGNALRSGNTKSCGCIHTEQLQQRNKQGRKYNKEDKRLVRIWRAMMSRCYKTHSYGYKWYGAKGIRVCEEWHEFENFKDWALNNNYKDDLTIERIDNNEDYKPENCKWADWETQANHTSSNKLITYNNKTQSLSLWVKELGLDYYRTKARINSCGWSIEDAFTKPKYAQVALSKDKILEDKVE